MLLCCILVALCCIMPPTSGKIGFKKDQSLTRIDFPPKIGLHSSSSGIPQGHLRPLGWQRKPEGPVPEVISMPAPKEFFETYVLDSEPIVFRDAMKDVPAMSKWEKDDQLKEEFGELDIHVVVKKDLLRKGPQKMKFRKFLREYQFEEWYLTTSLPQPMMSDLIVPKCLKCGLQKYLLESELWMSAGGTSSLLHSHADHNVHCLLAGRKDFIIIHPEHRSKLAMKEKSAHPGEAYSEIDTEMVNMFKFKEVGKVPWKWSTLKPGDCIYIPAKYLHQVRSYGRSISWTMLWAPATDIDFSDCDGVNLDKPMLLIDTTPMWTYVDADRQLSNVRLNAASLRHHLLVLLRDEDQLRQETFRDFFEEIMSEHDDHPPVEDVWTLLDPEDKGNISREFVLEMDSLILDQVSKVLNSPHVRPHDEL